MIYVPMGLTYTNDCVQGMVLLGPSFIFEDSYASFYSSHRGLVDSFVAGLNKLVAETFRAGVIGSWLHADDVTVDITLYFSEGAESDDGDGSTNGVDVVVHPVDTEVIQL